MFVLTDCCSGDKKLRLAQSQKSIANLLTIVETYILTTFLRNSAIFLTPTFICHLPGSPLVRQQKQNNTQHRRWKITPSDLC